jgi:hypothetical protein
MHDATHSHRLLRSIREDGGRKALVKLVGLGLEALPAVREGLRHPDWRIRRDCLRFLDHQSDDESGRLAASCLDDPHPEVRKWAVHAVGCDRCKEEPRRDFDAVPLLLRALRGDPSLRVRRSAAVALAWNTPRDRRVAECLEEILRSESDAKIRMHAEGGLARQRADTA